MGEKGQYEHFMATKTGSSQNTTLFILVHVCWGSTNLPRPQQEAKYGNIIMKNTKNSELILTKYIKSKKDGKDQEKHIMR